MQFSYGVALKRIDMIVSTESTRLKDMTIFGAVRGQGGKLNRPVILVAVLRECGVIYFI